MKLFPGVMSKEKLSQVKTLLDFDNIYTAPAHGFKNAAEYYQKSSALAFLTQHQNTCSYIKRCKRQLLGPCVLSF